jgi:hypothetical protein
MYVCALCNSIFIRLNSTSYDQNSIVQLKSITYRLQWYYKLVSFHPHEAESEVYNMRHKNILQDQIRN